MASALSTALTIYPCPIRVHQHSALYENVSAYYRITVTIVLYYKSTNLCDLYNNSVYSTVSHDTAKPYLATYEL